MQAAPYSGSVFNGEVNKKAIQFANMYFCVFNGKSKMRLDHFHPRGIKPKGVHGIDWRPLEPLAQGSSWQN
jgi:hypothetical protein